MKLYVDDDMASALLTKLLRNAGHDVQRPADVGLSGSHDAAHFRHAIREKRVCLTGNHDDFRFLHELVIEAQGHHPGLLIVRRENNPKRDLTPKSIVLALGNLLASGLTPDDQVQILNHWR